MEIRVNEIMNSYNEEQRNKIKSTIMMMNYVGAPAPHTDEEFKAFCESVVNPTEKKKARKVETEEQKKARAKKAKKTRYTREIKEMEEKIAEMQRKINYRKEWIENN